MESAKQKDKGQSRKGLVDRMLGKVGLAASPLLSRSTLTQSAIQGTTTNTASLRVVEFHLMESLTSTQPTIVRRERPIHQRRSWYLILR
jgi:hypothetical protein